MEQRNTAEALATPKSENLHLCEPSWVRLNSEWEELPEANSLSSACLALGSLPKRLWEWDAVYLGYFPEKCAEYGINTPGELPTVLNERSLVSGSEISLGHHRTQLSPL